ncbi:MAG TPA: hypothetical protein VMV16_01720 [Solirubrobacteraceae bacterium]|nr:hypothetical protein [Solirubrobacteraceae bacterium]
MLCAAGCLFLGAAGASIAQAGTATGVNPLRNPSADCNRSNPNVASLDLQSFNACRAKEGVGPLVLPRNWRTLTQSEQEFVLINLERVNRGLAPIIGLSSALNVLAATGAATSNDPAFPSHGMTGGGGLWGEASSPLGATYEWMYDDGRNGYDANSDCPPGGGSGCWMHRDIILWKGPGTLVAGAASGGAGNHGSYAFEVVSGHSTAGLSFTWAHELRSFATKPGRETLGASAKSRPKRQKHYKKSREKSPKKPVKRSRASRGTTDTIRITVG